MCAAPLGAPRRHPGNLPLTGPGPTGVNSAPHSVLLREPPGTRLRITPAGAASRPTQTTPAWTPLVDGTIGYKARPTQCPSGSGAPGRFPAGMAALIVGTGMTGGARACTELQDRKGARARRRGG